MLWMPSPTQTRCCRAAEQRTVALKAFLVAGEDPVEVCAIIHTEAERYSSVCLLSSNLRSPCTASVCGLPLALDAAVAHKHLLQRLSRLPRLLQPTQRREGAEGGWLQPPLVSRRRRRSRQRSWRRVSGDQALPWRLSRPDSS